jgi:hypothetical protein
MEMQQCIMRVLELHANAKHIKILSAAQQCLYGKCKHQQQ